MGSSQNQKQDWEGTPKGKLANGLFKINMLGELISWESIRRGMKSEDRLRDDWADANHKLIYGERNSDMQNIDDDTGHIVLGDMSVTQTQPTPPPEGMSGLAKALIGASILVSGVGLGFGIPIVWEAFKAKSVTQPSGTDSDTQYQLRLGK